MTPRHSVTWRALAGKCDAPDVLPIFSLTHRPRSSLPSMHNIQFATDLVRLIIARVLAVALHEDLGGAVDVEVGGHAGG